AGRGARHRVPPSTDLLVGAGADLRHRARGLCSLYGRPLFRAGHRPCDRGRPCWPLSRLRRRSAAFGLNWTAVERFRNQNERRMPPIMSRSAVILASAALVLTGLGAAGWAVWNSTSAAHGGRVS